MAAIDSDLVEPAAPALSARERLAGAVARAGLAGDPLQPVLVAFGEAIDTATDRVSRAAAAACEAAKHASRSVDPSIEAEAVQRLAQALGDRALMEIERLAAAVTLRRRAVLGCTAAVLAIALTSAGYIAGLRMGSVATQRAEAGITEAFRAGPQGAAAWLRLMRANDLAQALSRCEGKALVTIDGRRACAVPLWLDPPRPTVPEGWQ